jgi:hypothetical protein
MLLALLLPDPCDEDCPENFKQKAREYLVAPIASGTVGPSDLELREALLKFIGDFANWDLASNRTYLEASRKLVKPRMAKSRRSSLIRLPVADRFRWRRCV